MAQSVMRSLCPSSHPLVQKLSVRRRSPDFSALKKKRPGGLPSYLGVVQRYSTRVWHTKEPLSNPYASLDWTARKTDLKELR